MRLRQIKHSFVELCIHHLFHSLMAVWCNYLIHVFIVLPSCYVLNSIEPNLVSKEHALHPGVCARIV